MFHTLQPDQVEQLRRGWSDVAREGPLTLRFTEPKPLGGGVAIAVESPALCQLRVRLIEIIPGSLTRQDGQPFRAHVTIQNKVPAVDARRLFDRMSASFTPWDGWGEAVLIWKYLGGPWALDSELGFRRDGVAPLAAG